MTVEPYASARRVFWIVDSGSSHAGKTSIARMHNAHDNAELIHLPVHASWLNQAELFFSIVQCKALTPNDFGSLQQLARRLIALPQHRPPVPVDLHPPRPRPRLGQNHPPARAPCACRLNTATLADTSTSTTVRRTTKTRRDKGCQYTRL
jgi:hypothetical protein